MGVQRWGTIDMWPEDDGEFVSFTDHEQVVSDLRAELAAKSKEIDSLNSELGRAYGRGFPDFNKEIGEEDGR